MSESSLHYGSLAAAFVLGACAATASSSSASNGASAIEPQAPQIIPIERAEHRIAPSGTAEVQILALGLNAFMARLHMQPHAIVPEHRDCTEEYIHVLEGAGTITIDHVEYPLLAGSTVYMPANALVSFRNGHAPLVGLQVFAGPAPADKYNAWTRVP